MNFNFNSQPEYELNTTLTTELINLYGIATKFLVTEKINSDDNIFGDYSHLKTDSEKIYDINMLPETSEDWDSSGYNFDGFGFGTFENIVLFAARSSFQDEDHDEFCEIVGNLIVLPNNKIMEVTDVDATVPGINNLFTFNDAKSVYQLTCKPYDAKIINEVSATDISVTEDEDYETLDNYFEELMSESTDQDTEAEVTDNVTIIKQPFEYDNDGEYYGDNEVFTDADIDIESPFVDTNEDSVWGDMT